MLGWFKDVGHKELQGIQRLFRWCLGLVLPFGVARLVELSGLEMRVWSAPRLASTWGVGARGSRTSVPKGPKYLYSRKWVSMLGIVIMIRDSIPHNST